MFVVLCAGQGEAPRSALRRAEPPCFLAHSLLGIEPRLRSNRAILYVVAIEEASAIVHWRAGAAIQLLAYVALIPVADEGLARSQNGHALIEQRPDWYACAPAFVVCEASPNDVRVGVVAVIPRRDVGDEVDKERRKESEDAASHVACVGVDEIGALSGCDDDAKRPLASHLAFQRPSPRRRNLTPAANMKSRLSGGCG